MMKVCFEKARKAFHHHRWRKRLESQENQPSRGSSTTSCFTYRIKVGARYAWKIDEETVTIRRSQIDHRQSGRKFNLITIFQKTLESETVLTQLTFAESGFGRTRALVCEAKGPEDKFAVFSGTQFCRILGHERFYLQCDPEPSTVVLQNALCNELPNAIPLVTQEKSKLSLGFAERAHQTIDGLARTYRGHIKQKYGIALATVCDVMIWLIRHGSWAYD